MTPLTDGEDSTAVAMFTNEETTKDITIRAGVSDVEPIAADRQRGTVKMAPHTIQVVYTQHDHGPWVVEVVRLGGYVLKADGSPGRLTRCRTVYPHELPSAPPWVQRYVQSKMPSTVYTEIRTT